MKINTATVGVYTKEDDSVWLHYNGSLYPFCSLHTPLNVVYDYACKLVKCPSNYNAWPHSTPKGMKHLGKMLVKV